MQGETYEAACLLRRLSAGGFYLLRFRRALMGALDSMLELGGNSGKVTSGVRTMKWELYC
jgi:hypothetical protein